MIQIESFVFSPFMENTYVLYNETKHAIIIDPGCYEKHEKEALISFLEKNQLQPSRLINTHCHIDHVLGNAFVKRSFDLTLGIHAKDLPLLRSVETYAGNYGFPAFEPAEADYFIEEGELIHLGEDELEVLFVPGHAPGHIALVNHAQKFIIGGDVLFQGSVGRVDLPGGDMDTLIKSIHEKFFPLGDDYVVHCGHGPSTTLGVEKRSNPFCALV